MKQLRKFLIGADAELGQAVVLIAIVLLGMLMMVGLAIDAGQLYSARRAMQESADAAAYAAAVTLYQGGTQAQAFAAATADATTNGFTHDGVTTWITIQQPTTAPYNTDRFIEVIIQRDVKTSLVPAEASLNHVTVHAIGAADSLNNDYAIMALDRNATPDAFIVGANATLNINGGGIVVNSTAGNAALNGTPTNQWNITCPSTNPCNIDVAGGTASTWPNAQSGSPDYYNGERSAQPQVTDPFAGYPKPSTTNLPCGTQAACTDRGGFGPGSDTLGTGIYTGNLAGKNLCHGIYILKGGGMGGDIGVDTTSTDPVTGDICDGKVFIFNTLTNYPAVGGTCSAMGVSGNHDVTMYAMTTGTYAGLLVYQDSACSQPMVFGGTAFTLNATGTIYLPNALFSANGHPTIDGGQIVAKTIDLQNSILNINYNPNTSARPILPRLTK
jgi:Putative Flp pilus-assembly TadE/G-like